MMCTDALENDTSLSAVVSAVVCDWVHLSSGWTSSATTCFGYIAATAKDVMMSMPLTRTLTRTLTPLLVSKEARQRYLASLRAVYRFRPSRASARKSNERLSSASASASVRVSHRRVDDVTADNSEPADTPMDVSSSRGFACGVRDSYSYSNSYSGSNSNSNRAFNIRMTPMACSSSQEHLKSNDSTSCHLSTMNSCVLEYSLIQFALGLMRWVLFIRCLLPS
jgi:hypothetical protein